MVGNVPNLSAKKGEGEKYTYLWGLTKRLKVLRGFKKREDGYKGYT